MQRESMKRMIPTNEFKQSIKQTMTSITITGYNVRAANIQ